MKNILPNLLRYQCRQARPQLWDYVAERLSEDALEKTERHLQTCPACRQEARSLKRAQDLLMEARLQDAPEPKKGWADLQSRLLEPGAYSGTASAVAEYESLVATPAERRSRTRSRWASSMAMASSVAMLMLSASLTYRTLSLQQNLAHGAATPVGLHSPAETDSATENSPKTPANIAKNPQPALKDNTSESNGEPEMTPAAAKNLTPKAVVRQNRKTPFVESPAKTRRPAQDSIQTMAAGYRFSPEITGSVPPASSLRFQPQKTKTPERAAEPRPHKEMIMGTLTPVAREEDSAY